MEFKVGKALAIALAGMLCMACASSVAKGKAPAASYPDYSRELSAGILSGKPVKGLSRFAQVKGRFLVLDLAALDSDRPGPVQVEIFDIRGSLLFSKSFPSLAGQAGIEIPLSRISRHGGLCLMRLKSSLELKTQMLWLPTP